VIIFVLAFQLVALMAQTREELDQRNKECSEHNEQIQKMSKELLASNLEADRLRAKLASYEMKEKPQKSEEIVQRTLKSAMAKPPAPQSFRTLAISMFFLLIVALCLAGNIRSIDSLCQPVVPGTKIDSHTEPADWEAPWWAPASAKEMAFEKVCGTDRARVRLSWGSGKVSLWNLQTGKPMWTKKVVSAVIDPDRVAVQMKHKGPEFIPSPWSN